ncbi:hypothetical protein [Streptomyces resistomycificus]|uniref:hypothetical protein n=1 Tax=Streptomyces resistomycificus TaxID=67356 RepID=UPI00068930C7|nr:hypothetical protein [Streptomyces resistomycificus]KUO01708.1 hypothetical protein AQJ84_04570 [Streptomyces resistomycificus]
MRSQTSSVVTWWAGSHSSTTRAELSVVRRHISRLRRSVLSSARIPSTLANISGPSVSFLSARTCGVNAWYTIFVFHGPVQVRARPSQG